MQKLKSEKNTRVGEKNKQHLKELRSGIFLFKRKFKNVGMNEIKYPNFLTTFILQYDHF